MTEPTFFLPDQEVEWTELVHTVPGRVTVPVTRFGRVIPRDGLPLGEQVRAELGDQLPVDVDGTTEWVFRSELRPVREPESKAYQYRAVVTCSEDPCSYCGRSAQAHLLREIKDDYAEALVHGRRMNNHVYGASTHRVTVERREVGPWTETES